MVETEMFVRSVDIYLNADFQNTFPSITVYLRLFILLIEFIVAVFLIPCVSSCNSNIFQPHASGSLSYCSSLGEGDTLCTESPFLCNPLHIATSAVSPSMSINIR